MINYIVATQKKTPDPLNNKYLCKSVTLPDLEQMQA